MKKNKKLAGKLKTSHTISPLVSNPKISLPAIEINLSETGGENYKREKKWEKKFVNEFILFMKNRKVGRRK